MGIGFKLQKIFYLGGDTKLNKKILKILKTIIIAIIIVSLVLSVIVSLDYHHLETCEDEHCCICTIIHIAQNIVSWIFVVYMYAYTSFLIYFCLARMRLSYDCFVRTSLIFQKVQLNE